MKYYKVCWFYLNALSTSISNLVRICAAFRRVRKFCFALQCTTTNKELWGESRCRMEHKMLESILLQSSPQAAFTHNASHALMEGGKLSTYNSAWLLFSTCPENVIIGSKNVKASSHFTTRQTKDHIWWWEQRRRRLIFGSVSQLWAGLNSIHPGMEHGEVVY